jgi:hypothetical protein
MDAWKGGRTGSYEGLDCTPSRLRCALPQVGKKGGCELVLKEKRSEHLDELAGCTGYEYLLYDFWDEFKWSWSPTEMPCRDQRYVVFVQ